MRNKVKKLLEIIINKIKNLIDNTKQMIGRVIQKSLKVQDKWYKVVKEKENKKKKS